MKALLSGILLAAGIGIVAVFALTEAQNRSYETYSTTGARVGDPGSNLVGAEWADVAADESGS